MKVKIKSFTRPNMFYEVDTERHTCSCMAFIFHKNCKHLEKVMSEHHEKLHHLTISQRDKYRDFIENNKSAVKFVETFSENILTTMKEHGEVIEVKGELILI